ncbi:MAG: protein-disulfide reductase DsbD [Betaproteobacteria bacterium]|nr:protein-disulfide reductase DsbD [Betaproteobacteria bacterium]
MTRRLFRVFLLLLLTLISPASLAGNSSAPLKEFFANSSGEDEFLSPDAAFGVDIHAEGKQIKADFRIAPGYYLYKDRIKFALKPALAHEVHLPNGDIKNDPNFGKIEVYHQDMTGVITLKDHANQHIIVKATYQGCSEKGLCYAPQHQEFALKLKNSGSDQQLSANSPSNSDSHAANLLENGQWWLIILGFFTAGLLLAFTPCVFPMIPILSSMIIGKNAHTSRLHAFNLSLAYTMGMCVTYTLAGIAAGLSGQMLSNALQSPLALGFGASIFVLLSLSMFGFYELKLPHALENKFLNWNQRFKGGNYVSDLLMGALSALIISPCVAAPLAGALLYISKTHDVVLGGVALFSLSLGMGAPLLAIGASAGTLLPKAGAWMNTIRHIFGVLMLGVAVWLITPIIPIAAQMALWAALLIVPAMFMHAIDSLPANAKPIARLWKGVAIMMLIAGIALLIGALSNAKSPLQPLSGIIAKSENTHAPLKFSRVASISELEQQLQSAKGKTVMLDFYADWCVSCKELEQFTFSDSRVQAALKDTILLQVDMTDNTEAHQSLLRKFNLFGPPGIIFFNPEGHEEKGLKVVGFKNADDFLTTLHQRGSCLPDTIQC